MKKHHRDKRNIKDNVTERYKQSFLAFKVAIPDRDNLMASNQIQQYDVPIVVLATGILAVLFSIVILILVYRRKSVWLMINKEK